MTAAMKTADVSAGTPLAQPTPDAPPVALSGSRPSITSERLIGGRIELISQIGEGGCAQVWLGRHRDTGAMVAVKIAMTFRDQGEQAARFQREAELSGRLSHRHIVRVFDFVDDGNSNPALVMEHLRGESLDQLVVRTGGIPELGAVAVAVALLQALEHAHERGIIHRDLKPGNVFLAVEPDGLVVPKLLDFGIAKPNDSAAPMLTIDGSVLGTPQYMSPEQVRAHPLTVRSDLFSVAVLLYESITGASPFTATTVHAALVAVLERSVESHPAISPAVWSVLQRALDKDAERRYASATELREALLEVVNVPRSVLEDALGALGVTAPPLPDPRQSAAYRAQEAPTQSASSPALELSSLTRSSSSLGNLARSSKAKVSLVAAAVAAVAVFGVVRWVGDAAPSASAAAHATPAESGVPQAIDSAAAQHTIEAAMVAPLVKPAALDSEPAPEPVHHAPASAQVMQVAVPAPSVRPRPSTRPAPSPAPAPSAPPPSRTGVARTPGF